MENTSYTVKEVLEHYFKDMQQDIKEIKETGKETSDKVGIQNGRVTKIEAWCNEAKELIDAQVKKNNATDEFQAEIKAEIRSKWTGLKWAGAVILVIGGVAATLYIKEVATQAAQKVVDNLETKYNLEIK